MTSTSSVLQNPPIIEAVVDIDCDLPTNFDLAQVEKRATISFAENYPILEKRNRFEAEFKSDGSGGPQQATQKVGLQTLMFYANDRRQLVQFRDQGFSFNRLEPYSSLDDYLLEIEDAWSKYCELVFPIRSRLIRLRYVNRFMLNFDEAMLGIDEYLSSPPQTADPNRLAMTGFLNQYSAVEPATGNQTFTVITMEPPNGNKVPIIFDNMVASQSFFEPNDWPGIRDNILELRELKNYVFERTLTQKCRNLFI